MYKFTFQIAATIVSLGVLTACTQKSDTPENPAAGSDIEAPSSNQGTENPFENAGTEEDEKDGETVEQEQKQMALDTLQGLAKDAEKGKVYRLSEGIRVGHSTRAEIADKIGEPEEQDDFDHYHGSMGNASYDLAYDESGILKEARYFGTNIERQTNLGGITEEDLIERLGEPHEVHTIPETTEKNYRYHIEEFELQFIMGKDGKVDHVNLKRWE